MLRKLSEQVIDDIKEDELDDVLKPISPEKKKQLDIARELKRRKQEEILDRMIDRSQELLGEATESELEEIYNELIEDNVDYF